MREAVESLNQVSTAIFAAFINTAVLSGGALMVALLAARWKALNAASRYLLWWLALALVVAAPFVSHMLPDRTIAPAAVASPAYIVIPVATALQQLPVPVRTTIPMPRISAAAIILLCWLAAGSLQLIRVAYSFVSGLRLKRRGLPAPAAVESLFREVCQLLGLRRPVTLTISEHIASPAVAGYFRPQVLLPSSLITALNRTQIEQILTHELAHVKRYDDWAVAAQRFLEAVYVFHPLVWLLSRGLNLYREMACDDVVATGHEAGAYAECLAKAAGVFDDMGDAAVLVPLFERKSELLARVEVMLDRTRSHMPNISGPRLAAALGGLLVVGALGLHTPKLFAAELPQIAQQDPEPPAPAAPAPPAAEPAAPVSPESHTGPSSIIITSKDGQSYAFQTDEDSGGRGAGSGRARGFSLRRGTDQPDTIEFRSNGQLYVIRDPATLARAEEILKPIQELGRRQGLLGERQGKLGEHQGLLGEQQRTLVERKLDPAEMTQLQEQLQKMKSQMDQVKAQTAQEMQAKLAELQAQLGEMQAQIVSQRGNFGHEQSQLAQQQEALARQQEMLGRQQEALGRQQEAASKRALQELSDLIRNAQAKGLAQPLH